MTDYKFTEELSTEYRAAAEAQTKKSGEMRTTN